MTHPSLKSLGGYRQVNYTRFFKWQGPKIRAAMSQWL